MLPANNARLKVNTMNDHFLDKKLQQRREQNAYRYLRLQENRIDFCSNDYLGLAKIVTGAYYDAAAGYGSTGSRLLAGNYALIEETEQLIAAFHQSEAGLIFNSGYDANLGLLSCVPQRGDTILYDYLSHASIRDGIRLSLAQSFSFLHNDVADLEKKLQQASGNIFVVTESVFSMDGDLAPLRAMVALCKKYQAHLVVDEAHATGVVGEKGEGLVQQLGLQNDCFARINTFGKGIGAHGAIVLGTGKLREYLINFSRPFIYTTSLPASSIGAVKKAYEIFPEMHRERAHLHALVQQFKNQGTRFACIESNTPIQVVVIPGNEAVKAVAETLQKNNLDVRAILYPTVPKGSERLRIVLHAFNTIQQVEALGRWLQ
jgi:8-amino-7-oxononanoate synthase